MTCHYCPRPTAPESALCDFHADWECVCNLVEDEYSGATPRFAVLARMVAWGWREPVIEARLREEYVMKA